jgi:hypothetical protein
VIGNPEKEQDRYRSKNQFDHQSVVSLRHQRASFTAHPLGIRAPGKRFPNRGISFVAKPAGGAPMSKRVTTRWYIGAWVVYLITFIAVVMSTRSAGAQGTSLPSPATVVEYLILAVSGIVMLVMWIGALIKVGMQRAWGWFVALLVLHLLGLGIIGMVAYAVSGPEDEDLVVTRPTTPV